MKTIQQNLIRLMSLAGDTVNRLSNEIGESQSTIRRIVKGLVHKPDVDILRKIADYYGVPIESLYVDEVGAKAVDDRRSAERRHGSQYGFEGLPADFRAAALVLAAMPREEAAVWVAKINLAYAEHNREITARASESHVSQSDTVTPEPLAAPGRAAPSRRVG